MVETRKIGYYRVCHPFYMNKETIGFWNGEYWKFREIDSDFGFFDDDDLNWIDEKQLTDVNW